MFAQKIKQLPFFLLFSCFLAVSAFATGIGENDGNDKRVLRAEYGGQEFVLELDPVGICQQIPCGQSRTQTFKETIPNVVCRNLNQSAVENIVDQFVAQWCALELICCAPSQELCVRQCFRSSAVFWSCSNNSLTIKFSITTRCRVF